MIKSVAVDQQLEQPSSKVRGQVPGTMQSHAEVFLARKVRMYSHLSCSVRFNQTLLHLSRKSGLGRCECLIKF